MLKWQCTNSECEERKKDIIAINGDPNANLKCDSCGCPMEIIGGPDQVIIVGDKPNSKERKWWQFWT